MRLALYTDYALRTLIYLAANPGRARVADVASFYDISKDHVAKAVRQLVRLQYVRSIRGVGGGVELGRPADSISVGEVIIAFEGRLQFLQCVSSDGVCVIQPNCRLRHVLAEAERIQTEYLNDVLLSDIVKPEETLVSLTGMDSST